MAFLLAEKITSIDEMKEYAKNEENIGKHIKLNELVYILIKVSKPEQTYGISYECTINSVSSTWKDGNGIVFYLPYN
tara:strand:+ start:1816 stop:2046 length:231 start_codon:yes stop_codon:yes gene_type:complete